MTIVPLPRLGRREAAAAALAAKHRYEVSWATIAKTLDCSLVWSTSVVLGQQQRRKCLQVPLCVISAGHRRRPVHGGALLRNTAECPGDRRRPAAP
jgi:hypothetical protein